MDQDPTPTPANDGKPGVFNKLNGTIAGITGLVIALGGLAATWDRIFPNKQAEAAVPTNQEAEAVPPDETASAEATEEEAEPEADAPTRYTGTRIKSGNALKIEWDAKEEYWVVTDGDNDPWSYDDTTSKDPAKYTGVSNGHYLRWPIDGGEVDESDDREGWKTYGRVDAVPDSAAD